MQSIKEVVRKPSTWGVVTWTIVTIVALVVAWVYVNPPRQHILSFYTEDSMAVNVGDTVRVAGVIVGKVKRLSLEPDRVKVDASLDSDVFVGDQSQVQVRMLTVVGGYYVTVIPLGDRAIGQQPIPSDRVTMPYSLIRALSDTTKVTERVAPQPIKASIDEIQQGLTGANTGVLTKILDAGNTVADIMERQSGQVTRILDMSNEYIRTLNDNRELLEYLIKRVSILVQSLVLYGQGFGQALYGFGQVVERVATLVPFYMSHRSDFLARVRGVLGEFQSIADRNGALVGLLRRVRDRMEHTLAAQNNGTPPELLATDLCVPTEGSRC